MMLKKARSPMAVVVPKALRRANGSVDWQAVRSAKTDASQESGCGALQRGRGIDISSAVGQVGQRRAEAVSTGCGTNPCTGSASRQMRLRPI